jgi:hypothetical protein
MRLAVKRTIAALVFLVASCCYASTQEPQVDRLALISAGIFEAALQRKVEASDTASGTVSVVANPALVQSTNRVPSTIGIRFGLLATIVGHPTDANVSIKRVLTFPSVGLLNSRTGNRHFRYENVITHKIGAEEFFGYSFDHEWEAVPGEWTFQIWQGNRLLIEQNFTVYRP